MENLPRAERLRGRGSVGALFDSGSRTAVGVVLVRALPNDLNLNRMAAIAGRATGNAVRRSRQRRRLRAAYRAVKSSLPSGWDLAIIARRGVLEASWADLARDLGRAVRKAVMAPDDGPPPLRPRT